MITICKTVLSGTDPRRVREQAADLEPARLRDLAVRLAGHPGLTVSIINCDDRTQELEVLHSGPPARTEHTIDCGKFTRQPGEPPARQRPGFPGGHDAGPSHRGTPDGARHGPARDARHPQPASSSRGILRLLLTAERPLGPSSADRRIWPPSAHRHGSRQRLDTCVLCGLDWCRRAGVPSY